MNLQDAAKMWKCSDETMADQLYARGGSLKILKEGVTMFPEPMLDNLVRSQHQMIGVLIENNAALRERILDLEEKVNDLRHEIFPDLI